MSAIKRKFYYYRINDTASAFLDRLKQAEQLDMSIRATITHRGHQVMYQTAEREDYICGRVTLLRADQIPSIGTLNSTDALPLEIEDNQGVLEQSHFVYDPSHKILVFEYNHFGPRVKLLFDAVDKLFIDHIDTEADPTEYAYVPSGDGLDKIRRGRGVIALDVSYASVPELTGDVSATSLRQLFRQAAEVGEPQTIGLSLHATKKSKLMTATELIQNFLHSGRDIADYNKLVVKIENSTGAVEVIDLLQDRVVSKIEVLTLDRHRQLVTSGVYEKIITELQSKFGPAA